MKLVVVALLVALPVLSQSGSESRPSSDPAAVAVFQRAAAAQVQGGGAIAIRDFQAELECTMHDRDPKTNERSRRSATVIQYYRDRGADRPLFRRHLRVLQGDETIQGYDGNLYWQKLGNTAARDLRGRESQDERKRIISEINRTKDYLRFLFLRNLEGPDVVLRSGGTRTVKAGDSDRKVEVIVRTKPGEPPMELFIGDAGPRPVLFGFTRKMESGKTELIAFSVHEIVQSGGVTALVPLVAQYREDGELTFEARAPSGKIKFNTSIADALFAIPR